MFKKLKLLHCAFKIAAANESAHKHKKYKELILSLKLLKLRQLIENNHWFDFGLPFHIWYSNLLAIKETRFLYLQILSDRNNLSAWNSTFYVNTSIFY